MEKQCSEEYQIKGLSMHRTRKCRNKAIVKRDDEWYCGVHDPVKVLEKLVKKQEKQANENKKKRDLHYAYLQAKQARRKNG